MLPLAKGLLPDEAQGFLGVSPVKNLPDNAGDKESWVQESPGVGTGNPLNILAWKIPWPERNLVGYIA